MIKLFFAPADNSEDESGPIPKRCFIDSKRQFYAMRTFSAVHAQGI
jgi:hypothetical protein